MPKVKIERYEYWPTFYIYEGDGSAHCEIELTDEEVREFNEAEEKFNKQQDKITEKIRAAGGDWN